MGTDPGALSGATIALSLSQQEVWLDQAAWPGSGHLMIGGGGFLHGPLDLELCREALRKLVELHDGLRLAPLAQGGQLLLEPFEPALPLVDVAPGVEPLRAMQGWWQDHVGRPFVLAGQPPWRFAVLRCHDALHGLVMQFHHTVMDGWGVSQVMRQWSELYNLMQAGEPLPAPPAAGYAVFVEESRAYASSDAFARDAAYWKGQVAQLPAALLERRAGAIRGTELPFAQTWVQPLERAAYAMLREQATRQERTVFGLFLAALALYFARVANRSSVAIGVPTLNRGGKRYLHTPGMFVGVLVLQLPVSPLQTVASLVADAATAMRGALRHPRYPLSALGRQLDMVRSGRDGLFDVLLSFEQQDYGVHFGDAVRVDSRQFFSGLARYPLGVTVCEFHDSHDPELVLEGSAEYFVEGEVALLAQRIWHIARFLAANPDVLVEDVPLLPIEEWHALIEAPAASVVWHEQPETFVTAFERHAVASPQAMALVWDGGSWDYATLHGRANQLAHRLAALGA
ncbi:MAG: condensation domain-containing protein, partial [Burkholderiaceae bacterium]